ncbi:twist-related protein 2-like [Cloeon dipterum]|uniref:twist-related protein 2-like n=1 Tax=Cloeon dipterum TaxID=197152 RepID=UPI0032204F04
MEFYPEIKQEPDLVVDHAAAAPPLLSAPRWDDEDHYSPQLMDLSTKKVNNNYFFGTHPEAQHCYFEFTPTADDHDSYLQPEYEEDPLHLQPDLEQNDAVLKEGAVGRLKRTRRKASAVRSGEELESSRAVANHRERQRTKYLNTVLEDLRRIVPSLPSDKLSKKQILMLAAQYIEFLSQVVQCNQPFRGPVSRPSSPYKIREELGYCFRVWRMQTEYHGVDSPQ